MQRNQRRGGRIWEMTRCMGCMEEVAADEQVCRICGYHKGTDIKEAYYLLPGMVLNQKYLIGRVLGCGGFGVTYIGWDQVLQRKVAVKEYLPSDFATRSYGVRHLTVFSGEAEEQFRAGLDSFIYEARRLAKFNVVPEIVDIYDCFEENGTGYIVMEYLKGVTVKEILQVKKRIPVARARLIVLSVLRGLSKVHKEGIIHRDIAPDNIFITENGGIRILDFGAARYAATVQSRSLSVILKRGYAPEEQYRSHGNQGPWTDVYALGATFYRMITGVLPQESIMRLKEDHLQTPTELGISIEPNIENAIMNSLNVQKEYRIQDAESFFRALLGKEDVERIIEKKKSEINFKLSVWMRCSIVVVCVLTCICIGLYAKGSISFTKKELISTQGVAALSDAQCYVPDVSGMSYVQAEEYLKEKHLNLVISGMNYSDSISKNKILSQDPSDGAVADTEETVYVIMSGGREEVMMPDLGGMTKNDAEKLIVAQNLMILPNGIQQQYSDVVEKGRVISQSIEAEKRISVQTEVELIVSLGSLSEETAVLTVPDLIGLTQKEAVEMLKQMKQEYGFTYSLGEVKSQHSKRVPKGGIISQSLKAGSEVRTNETIQIVVSKGPQMIQVPDIVYMTQEMAVKKMEKAGLQVQIQTEYNSQVVEGLVIRQDLKAGFKAEKGTAVTIIVSKGKAPVQQSDNGTGKSQPDVSTNNQSSQRQPDSNQSNQRQPGSNQTEQNPSGSSGSGGERVIMPDGGSFVVE